MHVSSADVACFVSISTVAIDYCCFSAIAFAPELENPKELASIRENDDSNLGITENGEILWWVRSTLTAPLLNIRFSWSVPPSSVSGGKRVFYEKDGTYIVF
ncbi:hypothetical protein V6Z12_A08G170700 [Gossypium hirsutum]